MNGHSASQIFVIEPNQAVFNKLISFAETFPNDEEALYTDEEVLHSFFEQEVKYNKIIPLYFVFNWNRCGITCEFIENSLKIRGVHMTGTEKP